jgi:hypothetical protein
MFTTIITDCKGENEAGRQIARYNSLGLGPTGLIGIDSGLSDDSTVEGAANLIDILDSVQGKPGVVVLNVAPRGNKKDGGNGSHFAYFYYKDTLVISTIKGYCLAFIKKFGITNKVNVVELSNVLDFTYNQQLTTYNQKDYIVKSQFRSFDFVPRLARWLVDGIKIPSNPLFLTTHYSQPPSCVWCIDAFGNCKTTLTANDLSLKDSPFKIKTNIGVFPFYKRLKDVPFGKTAIYIGSSGIGNKRFLEIATQGVAGSAAKKLSLKIGDKFEITKYHFPLAFN